MKLVYTLLLFLLINLTTNTLCAQVEKVIYQSLMVSDSTMQIEFDVADVHEIIPWHHEGRVMIETTTRLDGANMDLLGLFISEGRYKIVSDEVFPVTTMRYAHPNRHLVKNHRGEICKETVTMKIYIPEGFVVKKTVEPVTVQTNSKFTAKGN